MVDNNSTNIWQALEKTKIPVVRIASPKSLESILAQVIAASFSTIEITLRSDYALKAIKEAKSISPDLIVGAGTITRPEQVEQALDAGAEYLVSPGWSDGVWRAIQACCAPESCWCPGVVTPTEVMHAAERGFQRLKFFPAAINGGLGTLKTYQSVFPHIRFCPTGGIGSDEVESYLARDNVFAVGGSAWISNT